MNLWARLEPESFTLGRQPNRAQRRRELDRLNEIERQRHFLELKKQNDLFDQLADQLRLASPSQAEIKLQADQSATTTRHGESSQAALDKAKVDQRKVSPELEVLREQELHASMAPDCLTRERPMKSPSEFEDEESLRQSLSSYDISTFVNQQVPANKRVLCLIVRDKISRLNRAKSYFYPTYYLFIQTIVDVADCDSAGLGYFEPSGAQSSERLSDGAAVNQDEQEQVDEEDQVERPENSFSASSSISADMLFIGTESGAQTNGRQPGCKEIGRLATSYSDNEVYADAELDEQVSGSSYLRYPDKRELGSLEKSQRRQPDTSDSDSLAGWPTSAAANRSDVELGRAAGADRIQVDVLERKQGEDRHRVATSDISNLFENDKNPFTGTYGVLLSGRKRKKART